MAGSGDRSTSREARVPTLGLALSRQADGPLASSNIRRQPLSPPLLPAASAGSAAASLPPPPPTRLHSYHHPIAASYASSSNSSSSSSSYFDRSRQPPPPLWKEQRSPPLEDRTSESAVSPSFSRVLPPLLSSNSSSNVFQLPSMSASLPSSASWHGASNGANVAPSLFRGAAQGTEPRRPGHNSKLLSLSGQFSDFPGPSRPLLAEAAPAGMTSPGSDEASPAGRKPVKAHVPSACLNCKRAHLACDVGRPCRRCVNLGKSDTCIDVQHKKRGRPRLKDRPSSQAGMTTLQSLEGKSDNSGSPASASYARQSPSSESGYFRSPSRANELLSPPSLSSSTVMHVSGRTHGAGAHPRSASNSVSASSYPYSRPDHVHYPVDVSGSHGVGHPTPSWSSQQSGSHAFGAAPPVSGRHHSHSISYEQQYHPQAYQRSPPQRQLQQAPFRHAPYGAQQSPGPHAAASELDTSDGAVSAVVTIICSTNLQCARISEECMALLGYQPTELNERSLFELVHPSEAGRLQEIWSSLIDPVGVIPQAVPAAADVVRSTPAARLMAPAAGTIFVQEDMRLRQRNGMYDFYSVRLHLGGGFGVDLYRRETLDRAYIVASLLKLGNDAVHPDPAVLRSPYLHDTSQAAQGFRTPSTPSATARAAQPAEQQQRRQRSESVHLQRPTHLESNMRRNNAPPSQHKMETANVSRGVKRNSAEMDQDEPATSSGAAPPLNASYAKEGGANTSLYGSASKGATLSPPPATRSMLTERPRGSTSRDGILC
ncbi:hypothetical protein EX895_004656 [Sporisorium graminicola]|uniref:Transcription activator of gluconeogenesis ERT1 n=1 Tax=Sporisorium graminicola TaxID=280036 RepID=A0A4U7KRF0_9BASI|nr:hypothetical protein EX895_004656 [Sporisorium graminicola]TKY86507.1 hypothetical protein EX895_004656 [Sporisorium graminicola]